MLLPSFGQWLAASPEATCTEPKSSAPATATAKRAPRARSRSWDTETSPIQGGRPGPDWAGASSGSGSAPRELAPAAWSTESTVARRSITPTLA
jgi:hypothetical protein